MPVPPAHSQGLGQSPFVNRTMLYISLLLCSDYINNAGKASVQHNEIIFLILVDSYGNSLANNLPHHQWPQITAVFKNLRCSWKLRRLITWTGRDRKMCQKLLGLELLTVSLPFFPPRSWKLTCHLVVAIHKRRMKWVEQVNKWLCLRGNWGAARHWSTQKPRWEL